MAVAFKNYNLCLRWMVRALTIYGGAGRCPTKPRAKRTRRAPPLKRARVTPRLISDTCLSKSQGGGFSAA
eukprot:3874859-Pyramimonas_sp.AAC.1